MESHLTEEQQWATRVAGRLRSLQASLGDAPVEEQRKTAAEEIARELKGVAPSRRRGYLGVLAEWFPTWEVAALPGTGLAVKPEIIEDTPERRWESFLQIVPQLTPEKKAEYQEKLAALGMGRSAGETAEWQAPAELAGSLSVAAGQKVAADRALKLLAALMDFGLGLDQIVWSVWKQLAPKSGIRREASFSGGLREEAGRYLRGEEETALPPLAQSLEQMRKLTAGLLMAIGGVGRTYGKKHLERFSPEVIRDLAEMSKGWGGVEKKAWEKYVELSREFGAEQMIEKEIEDVIIRYAEEVMRGRFANSV